MLASEIRWFETFGKWVYNRRLSTLQSIFNRLAILNIYNRFCNQLPILQDIFNRLSILQSILQKRWSTSPLSAEFWLNERCIGPIPFGIEVFRVNMITDLLLQFKDHSSILCSIVTCLMVWPGLNNNQRMWKLSPLSYDTRWTPAIGVELLVTPVLDYFQPKSAPINWKNYCISSTWMPSAATITLRICLVIGSQLWALLIRSCMTAETAVKSQTLYACTIDINPYC